MTQRRIEIRTYHLPDDEWMRYVLSHGRGSYLGVVYVIYCKSSYPLISLETVVFSGQTGTNNHNIILIMLCLRQIFINFVSGDENALRTGL